MQEIIFWGKHEDQLKEKEISFEAKLQALKIKIRDLVLRLNSEDVHRKFVEIYKEAENDRHKELVCDSALKYFTEKWASSSHENLLHSRIDTVIDQLKTYWNEEKKQLNFPVKKFS